jgi:hypothetical protein
MLAKQHAIHPIALFRNPMLRQTDCVVRKLQLDILDLLTLEVPQQIQHCRRTHETKHNGRLSENSPPPQIPSRFVHVL